MDLPRIGLASWGDWITLPRLHDPKWRLPCGRLLLPCLLCLRLCPCPFLCLFLCLSFRHCPLCLGNPYPFRLGNPCILLSLGNFIQFGNDFLRHSDCPYNIHNAVFFRCRSHFHHFRKVLLRLGSFFFPGQVRRLRANHRPHHNFGTYSRPGNRLRYRQPGLSPC